MCAKRALAPSVKQPVAVAVAQSLLCPAVALALWASVLVMPSTAASVPAALVPSAQVLVPRPPLPPAPVPPPYPVAIASVLPPCVLPPSTLYAQPPSPALLAPGEGEGEGEVEGEVEEVAKNETSHK